MKAAATAAGALGIVFAGLAIISGRAALQDDHVTPAESATTQQAASAAGTHQGLIYGRVTLDDGQVYQGRLRWGGDEEALWSNQFNGFMDENPWAAHLTAEQLPSVRESVEIFGLTLLDWDSPRDLGRPFMARMGDLARIDPRGSDLQVTLKSGTVYHLDRYSADDLADGLRVWDAERGVVDIGERNVRSIEFLAPADFGSGPYPLYGTVHTAHGAFTGFVQWDREECLDSDALDGLTADGAVSVPFHDIRTIERRTPDNSLVTLRDGREIDLSGTRNVGTGNRGVYVDDPRYGRVLVSWDAFERVDFDQGGTGPGYDDYLPGSPLMGTVVTRDGRRITGRLVYDLDESETTETLDAPAQGVDYTIPFALVASVEPGGLAVRGAQHARVTLRSGEELTLESDGDLGQGNAGMLVFVDGRRDPEYVAWPDVQRVEFAGPT